MNTTFANRIYIQDPSDALKAWADENLRFPNPEFEKKQRMGFWTGRTPRELRMYEWDGNTLILPFGVSREIMPLLHGTRIECDFKQDSVIVYDGEDVPLYDYQQIAVQEMIKAKYGILKSTTGSGKTQMGIALIKRLRRRALWLCHTADLLNQSRDRALQYMNKDLIGTITEGKVNVGVGVTFATVQTMANLELQQYRDYWDVVIVDECFPGDTNILTTSGFKQICDITIRDKVIALDDNGNLRKRRIKKVFKKTPESLVKITLENGNQVYCTANHPILTERGYINAGYLTHHDSVYCLRGDDGYILSVAGEKEQHSSRKREGLLFGRMPEKNRELLDRGTTGKSTSNNDCVEQEECLQKNEGKQSDAECRNTGNCKKETSGNASSSFRPWRKRKGINDTSKDIDEGTSQDLSDPGICNSDKDSKRKRISNLLQSGYRLSGEKDSNRDRREFPLFSGTAEPGQEERRFSEFVRVESVEIQEQTSDGTYGGLCPDGYVYNLHVSRNHNYFANGMNVHNCHRVSSSATTFTRYEKVLNHLSARHKYGLTATPDRSDGLIKATYALIGKVAYEVPDSAVADKVMKVAVRRIETGTQMDEEKCLNYDGTINYVKLIEYLTTDNRRNFKIASMIVENKGHSCLIISDRLSQLQDIMELLPKDMLCECAFINGKMQSKKAKAEREQAIEDMRTGKKKYLFASYSLCKEGLDIPRLDRLFLASPAKFSSVITQAVGRIRRTAEGKGTPIVLDFVDEQIGYCDRAYRERKRSYRKMGAEILE